MEENRLKPMKPGYDEELFNEYFKRTENLRRKLARQINPDRFGVGYDEILSWFSVKFIYIFNKYYGTKDDGHLLGDLIKGLQMFKYRILRAAYTEKFSQIILSSDDDENPLMELTEKKEEVSNENLFLNLALSFMKKNLSEDAYELLQLQLQPPPYIIRKMVEAGSKNFKKIPDGILAEYLELGEGGLNYIDRLKRQIKKATNEAREYFSENPPILPSMD